MEDRRQYPRVPVRYLGTFSTAQRTTGEGLVLDLSPGGCRVESSTYVQLGTALGLCISLPNQVTPLTVDRAMVRWGHGLQFGLSFMSLRPEEQARLPPLGVKSVHANPATIPPSASIQSATILLVEDDKGLRDLIRSMLIQRGYRVLSAGDFEVALKIARSHPASIDLLISDVVMPGLNGPELARRLRALRPNLSVLFMSGFMGEAALERGTLPNAWFLAKPFPSEALVGKVKVILLKGYS